MRILGIDYGDARVGVAVSDLLGLTAQGVGTVKNTGAKKLMAELLKIIEEYKPETIVIGMPKNMDGTEGESAQNARAFAEKLKELTGLPVEMQDERGTTVTAHHFLNDTNTRGKKRKNVVDEVAATIILQNYLDSRKT